MAADRPVFEDGLADETFRDREGPPIGPGVMDPVVKNLPLQFREGVTCQRLGGRVHEDTASLAVGYKDGGGWKAAQIVRTTVRFAPAGRLKKRVLTLCPELLAPGATRRQLHRLDRCA